MKGYYVLNWRSQTSFLTDVHLIRACRSSCVKVDFSHFYFEVVSKYVLMC